MVLILVAWAPAFADVAAARAMLDRGEVRQAFEQATSLAAARPDDPAVQLLLGDAAARSGIRQVAADAYLRAIELDPSNAVPYLRAADWLLAVGDREGARQCYRAAADIAPRSAAPQAGLGVTYVLEYSATGNVNKLVLGLPYLEKAVALEGATAQDHYAYADALLMRAGRGANPTVLQPCERTIAQGLDRFPDHPLLLYARARLRDRLGKTGAAREDLRRALELGLPEPDAVVAKAFLQAFEEEKSR